jgi:anti-anti-sigma regulatory factor
MERDLDDGDRMSAAITTRFHSKPTFASELRLQIWTRHSFDRAVVNCIGDIVYQDEADALVKAISSIRQRLVYVDLKHVRTIDAYGLGKLLYLQQALEKQHQRIMFANPNEMMQHLFCIMKLDFHFACECGRVLRPVQ